MARTALDLSLEQLREYRPDRELDQRQATERWQQAWEVARTLARLLREKFGATRVVAFGSLTDRAWFGPWSDIDVAAWGIPAERFYGAVAAATGLSSVFEVDLVDPEGSRPAVRRVIEREGLDL